MQISSDAMKGARRAGLFRCFESISYFIFVPPSLLPSRAKRVSAETLFYSNSLFRRVFVNLADSGKSQNALGGFFPNLQRTERAALPSSRVSRWDRVRD